MCHLLTKYSILFKDGNLNVQLSKVYCVSTNLVKIWEFTTFNEVLIY